jgi:hypothetical protein
MAGDDNLFVSLLPMIIISIPLAVGNYIIAPRLNKNRVLWVVLSLIPIFNIGFVWYVFYRIAIRVLDRLDAISQRLGVETERRV